MKPTVAHREHIKIIFRNSTDYGKPFRAPSSDAWSSLAIIYWCYRSDKMRSNAAFYAAVLNIRFILKSAAVFRRQLLQRRKWPMPVYGYNVSYLCLYRPYATICYTTICYIYSLFGWYSERLKEGWVCVQSLHNCMIEYKPVLASKLSKSLQLILEHWHRLGRSNRYETKVWMLWSIWLRCE